MPSSGKSADPICCKFPSSRIISATANPCLEHCTGKAEPLPSGSGACWGSVSSLLTVSDAQGPVTLSYTSGSAYYAETGRGTEF